MTRQLAVNMGACALLLIQYLLGMVVNVYVVLPGRHPGASAGDYLSGAAAGLRGRLPALSVAGSRWSACRSGEGSSDKPGRENRHELQSQQEEVEVRRVCPGRASSRPGLSLSVR